MRRLLLALRLLAHTVRRRGLRWTWARLRRLVASRRARRARTASDRAFDKSRGVDTAAWVRITDLETSSPNVKLAVAYEPSRVEDFTFLMQKLAVDHSEFAFVDYGSGKGKVLILAADYPFMRIVGVEFSEPLDRIARRNIEAIGPARSRIETVVADAVDFRLPDEPLVLYFFNPFEPPVLRRVLERVQDSLQRKPRPAYIVVTAPAEFIQVIEESGFSPIDVERNPWSTRGIFAAPRALS